jgi:hypothetical protein
MCVTTKQCLNVVSKIKSNITPQSCHFPKSFHFFFSSRKYFCIDLFAEKKGKKQNLYRVNLQDSSQILVNALFESCLK